MYDDAYPSVRPYRRRARRRLRGPLTLTAASAALGFVAWTHLFGPAPVPRTAPVVAEAPAHAAPVRYGWMLDPETALGAGTGTLGRERPLAARFQGAPVPLEAPVQVTAIADPVSVLPERGSVRTAPSQMLAAARVAQAVPLPLPRPPEFQRSRTVEVSRSADVLRYDEAPRVARAARPEVQRLAARPVLPRTQTVFRAALPEEPSFLEKIFGGEASTGSGALAYASVERGVAETATRRRLGSNPAPTAEGLTAIYDISARTVYLPNGEAIEAHSGLGPSMDNPRNVHLSMRGATPPGTYDLTEREALFHGVRAIRLNPVGGSGAIHGRVGLLAHTYMLGPSGASNGCVSFRNYDRFLQAFLRGEVRRLVVVAGTMQDGPPASADRRLGLLGRWGRNGG